MAKQKFTVDGIPMVLDNDKPEDLMLLVILIAHMHDPEQAINVRDLLYLAYVQLKSSPETSEEQQNALLEEIADKHAKPFSLYKTAHVMKKLGLNITPEQVEILVTPEGSSESIPTEKIDEIYEQIVEQNSNKEDE